MNNKLINNNSIKEYYIFYRKNEEKKLEFYSNPDPESESDPDPLLFHAINKIPY